MRLVVCSVSVVLADDYVRLKVSDYDDREFIVDFMPTDARAVGTALRSVAKHPLGAVDRIREGRDALAGALEVLSDEA